MRSAANTAMDSLTRSLLFGMLGAILGLLIGTQLTVFEIKHMVEHCAAPSAQERKDG